LELLLLSSRRDADVLAGNVHSPEGPLDVVGPETGLLGKLLSHFHLLLLA
jgi:hypothetical protein